MKTINIADGLFITYKIGLFVSDKRPYECLIHMTGSRFDIDGFNSLLDEMNIDSDDVTLRIYCQEHLDGFHK